jgi:hypothetical protein
VTSRQFGISKLIVSGWLFRRADEAAKQHQCAIRSVFG